MDLAALKKSLEKDILPEDCPALIQALWYDAKGDWTKAHDIAQSKEGTRDYDKLHAYLHRKEGDEWNAGYWYRRAGVKVPYCSLEQEWDKLAEEWL